eukprot:Em0015g1106a
MTTSEEWRRAAIQHLEEAIRTCPGGPPPNLQNISEVENQFFANAKNKEEYESTVQRALVYIMNHKKQQQANRMNQQLPGNVTGMAAPGNLVKPATVPSFPNTQPPASASAPGPLRHGGAGPANHGRAAHGSDDATSTAAAATGRTQLRRNADAPSDAASNGRSNGWSDGRGNGRGRRATVSRRRDDEVIGQRMIQPYAQRPSMYEEVQSVTTIPNPSFPRAPGNAVPPYLPANAGVQNPPGKPSVPSPYSTVSMSPGPPIAQGSPSSLVGHTHLPVAQQSGVTSPAPATPILPPSPATAGNSPAHQPSMTPEENEAYLRKFQELQMYVPLLDRMLSKSSPCKTLHKCEQALKRMFEQQLTTGDGGMAIVPLSSATITSVAPGPPIPPVSLPQQQTKSQSLLELKMVSSPPPTFASLADTIQLNPFPVDRLPPSKRQPGSKGKGPLSPGLKREIASLEAFNFKVISSGDATEQDVILQCSLADTCLPSVPPLKVRIPFKYPKSSIEWANVDDYEKTPFYKLISSLVVDKVSKLPGSASLSSLLTTWEACVLKATSCELGN